MVMKYIVVARMLTKHKTLCDLCDFISVSNLMADRRRRKGGRKEGEEKSNLKAQVEISKS